MDSDAKIVRATHPREKANIFSLITFVYTRKLFTKGFKKDLEDDDLYDVIKQCKSKRWGDKLEYAYKAKESKKKTSTFRILWDIFGLRYIGLGIIHLLWTLISSVMEPEAVSKLVAYFRPGQTALTLHDAYYYAGIMIGLRLMRIVYFENYVIYLFHLAIQIRVSFCSVIYRKALRLSPKAFGNISLGNIVTLMTKDVLQFEHSLWLFNQMWIAVIQTILTCYLLYSKTGFSSSAGIAVLFSYVPVQIYCSRIIKRLRWKLNKRTDERLQITQETLSTIKIIKMYTWERIWGEKINEARSKEMKSMFINTGTKLLLRLSSSLVGKFGFYALLMVYIWVNNDMSAETLFYIMRCFGTLQHSVSMAVSNGFTKIAELNASMSRLDDLFQQDELADPVDKPDDEPQIEFRNVSVGFGEKKVLENINVKIQQGLTIVTGHLGCGKSSFVKTALKFYPADEGEVRTRGRKSYASQDPWLFPATIKQNILFGEKYDEERYKKVVKCCALQYDFNILEKGDETVVADRGLNLSKGQQARVNLARAVYKESDIYLIDDALTALDTSVQEQIFKDCIKEFLKDKLVLLVTHNPKHIEQADKLIILDDGKIKLEGPQKEVVKEILEAIEDETIEQIAEIEETVEETINEKTSLLKRPSHKGPHLRRPSQRRRPIYHEKKKEGSVDMSVYGNYLKSGGGIIIIVLIGIAYFSSEFTHSTSSKMLTQWINQQQSLGSFKDKYFGNISSKITSTSNPIEQINNDTFMKYEKLELKSSKTLNLYTILFLSSSLLELIKQYLILKFAVTASRNVHNKMVNSIVHSIMHFFDNCFIGNILNRFSQDLTVIDERLPMALGALMGSLFHLAGVIGLIATVDWKFMLPASVLILCMTILRYIYIPTARSLKRLEAATRSPLIGHLNSSIEGITTIRAFKAQDILKAEFDRHQDLYTSANYTALVSRHAFSFFMDFFSISFTIYIITKFLLMDAADTNSGDVGLTITQIGNLTAIFQHGLQHWAEVETLMTSVERVSEYSHLEAESSDGEKVEEWPTKGEMKYVNVSMSYSHEKVLKGISFSVKPKEKIGIVGRTGAGKSSIISTLFRLYDYEGEILIDNVEIKSLSLQFLRQNIAIIPQDPIMFSGTIRSNIDPLNEYTDEEIWKTLHKIHMDSVISSIDTDLETMNFSTGQRQLICLARAIMKKSKIVVLDEATANMDPETEKMIHKIIMDNFCNCTLLIIAHRLESILECNKVLVLEKGEILEYASPATLLEDKNSMFSTMIKNSGLNIEEINSHLNK